MSAPDIRYHTNNRIVAIDIVRIIAAFVVMYEHLGFNQILIGKFVFQGLTTLSPLFFVLAGYFACRNITLKKALNNSWWSFAPFLLWNAICVCGAYFRGADFASSNIFTLCGVQAIFVKEWVLFPDLPPSAYPYNIPLWFMRDLVVLFLLSPILVKCAKFVFPFCILLSVLPATAPYFHNSGAIFMGPRSLVFFTAGCLLQTQSKDFQKKALKFYSPPFIIIYAMIVFVDVYKYQIICNLEQWYTCKCLLGVWFFYQIARWVEVRIPIAKKLALKYAPVTFLTFAAHMILYRLIVRNPDFLPDWAYTTYLVLVPLLVFSVMSVFFFGLKRWCPSLLHLVAHYKLRPDDIQAQKKADIRE